MNTNINKTFSCTWISATNLKELKCKKYDFLLFFDENLSDYFYRAFRTSETITLIESDAKFVLSKLEMLGIEIVEQIETVSRLERFELISVFKK